MIKVLLNGASVAKEFNAKTFQEAKGRLILNDAQGKSVATFAVGSWIYAEVTNG